MIGNKEPSTALVRMLLDLWIGLHVHLAACSDADKSCPPSLVSFSPAYTLPLSPTTTHTGSSMSTGKAGPGRRRPHVSFPSFLYTKWQLFFKKRVVLGVVDLFALPLPCYLTLPPHLVDSCIFSV